MRTNQYLRQHLDDARREAEALRLQIIRVTRERDQARDERDKLARTWRPVELMKLREEGN